MISNLNVSKFCKSYFNTFYQTCSPRKMKSKCDIKTTLIFASSITLVIPLMFAVSYLISSCIDRIQKTNSSTKDAKINNLGMKALNKKAANLIVDCDLATIKANLDVINHIEPTIGVPLPGLNMLGVCKQEGCENKNKLTVIPKGFSRNLEEELCISKECSETICPCCKKTIDYDDVNDVILMKTKFSLRTESIAEITVKGCFQVNKNEILRINVQNLYYMILNVQPLD